MYDQKDNMPLKPTAIIIWGTDFWNGPLTERPRMTPEERPKPGTNIISFVTRKPIQHYYPSLTAAQIIKDGLTGLSIGEKITDDEAATNGSPYPG